MPPKGDSKGIMSPKGESHATAASGSNVANRTRGAAGRRMSREGAESAASEHDLIQYDREQAGGSGTASSSTPPSMSSAPATHNDITAEQRQQLDSFRQSQQQQMEVFYHSLIQQPVKPAMTARPAAKVELVPAVPVAPTSTTSGVSDSKSLTVDPSVARLLGGMVSHLGGLPIMGSSSSGAATVIYVLTLH